MKPIRNFILEFCQLDHRFLVKIFGLTNTEEMCLHLRNYNVLDCNLSDPLLGRLFEHPDITAGFIKMSGQLALPKLIYLLEKYIETENLDLKKIKIFLKNNIPDQNISVYSFRDKLRDIIRLPFQRRTIDSLIETCLESISDFLWIIQEKFPVIKQLIEGKKQDMLLKSGVNTYERRKNLIENVYSDFKIAFNESKHIIKFFKRCLDIQEKLSIHNYSSDVFKRMIEKFFVINKTLFEKSSKNSSNEEFDENILRISKLKSDDKYLISNSMDSESNRMLLKKDSSYKRSKPFWEVYLGRILRNQNLLKHFSRDKFDYLFFIGHLNGESDIPLSVKIEYLNNVSKNRAKMGNITNADSDSDWEDYDSNYNIQFYIIKFNL